MVSRDVDIDMPALSDEFRIIRPNRSVLHYKNIVCLFACLLISISLSTTGKTFYSECQICIFRIFQVLGRVNISGHWLP